MAKRPHIVIRAIKWSAAALVKALGKRAHIHEESRQQPDVGLKDLQSWSSSMPLVIDADTLQAIDDPGFRASELSSTIDTLALIRARLNDLAGAGYVVARLIVETATDTLQYARFVDSQGNELLREAISREAVFAARSIALTQLERNTSLDPALRDLATRAIERRL